MLISQDKQQVALLEALIRYMCPRAIGDKLYKDSDPFTSVKSLGIPSFGVCQNIPSKIKEKLLHLASPNMKKEAESLIALFGFWRKHIPCLRIALWPVYWVLWPIC